MASSRVFASFSIGIIFLAGCTVNPVPLSKPEIELRIQRDRQAMFAAQPPVTEPITFAGALARAYLFNLENRQKIMEDALAQGQLDFSYYDMLPHLTALAGYDNRNNDAGGTATNLRTGLSTTDPTVAEERTHYTDQLVLSWNMLDFGMSYVRAKQQANQVLIAEEHRRKTLQNIAQDVYSAYYRALAAQRRSADVDRLLKRAEQALSDAHTIEEKGLAPPVQILLYQRGLIEILQQMRARRAELESAYEELASLMNLPPDAHYSLADNPPPAIPELPNDINRLSEIALRDRSELREEDYRDRISKLEAKRILLSVLPSLQVSTGAYGDTNKYLYNSRWWENQATVSFNLFRVFSLPAAERQQEAQAEVDQARRMALAMSIVTQVHLAAERYRENVTDFELSKQLGAIDGRINQQVANSVQSQTEGELEQIRAEARALLSNIQGDYAQASLYSAYARLMNSVGIDLVAPDMPHDLATLTNLLERRLPEWSIQNALASYGS